MSDLVPHNPSHLIPQEPDFDDVVRLTLRSLRDSSKRIYARTYVAWCDWCEALDVSYLDVTGNNVYEFLIDIPASLSTRQRHLSAMRQLAKVLAIVDYTNPARKAAYDSLTLIKAPGDGAVPSARPKRALTPDQVAQLQAVWNGSTLAEIRNAALIALMFASGARRAEIVALTWDDLDAEQGILHIQEGKGGKPREIALLGSAWYPALKRWYEAQRAGVYIFNQLADDGDWIAADAPISTQRLYDIVLSTGERAGIEWRPHDARRSFITEQLLNGGALRDVQEQAGHTRGSTTLDYAQTVDAKERRKRLSVRW